MTITPPSSAPILLLAAALPLAAQAGDPNRASFVTGGERAAECIASVQVDTVDGERVYTHPGGFEVDPGTHTIGARAILDISFCKPVGPARNNRSEESLQVVAEAGKTYYLGYDHSSRDRDQWKLTIWKVEDSGG